MDGVDDEDDGASDDVVTVKQISYIRSQIPDAAGEGYVRGEADDR